MRRLQLFLSALGLLAVSSMVVTAQTSGVFFNEGWESGSVANSFQSSGFGSTSWSQFGVQTGFTGSGSWALRHHLTAGLQPGAIQYATQHFGDSLAGPVLPAGRGEHFMDLYVQYKIGYPTDFDFGTGLKQMIIGTQDDRRHDNPCCNPWVAHYLTIYPAHPSMGILLAEANNKQAASGQWVGFHQNASGYSPSNLFRIQTGRFYTIEVRRRLNDMGIDNGIFQLWIDGVLLSDYRQVRYRTAWNGTFGSNPTHGTNFAMISDYSAAAVARDQGIYYDDVKMSTSYIGLGSSPISPPTPPSNLRIVP